MSKEFLEWWELNRFQLMQNDEVGLREIAYAAWQAGQAQVNNGIEATPPS